MKADPFWWDKAPLTDASGTWQNESDIVIVGSGITAMVAARILLNAGRSVTILDANEPGSGASTRNAGYVSRSFKHGFLDLTKKHGLAYAIALYKELQASVDAVYDLVKEENIDCDLHAMGRFMPATNRAGYDALARDLEAQQQHLGTVFEMLPKSRQHEALRTDVYEGGAILPDLGGLHPGKYHAGLLSLAVKLGANLLAHTTVTAIEPAADGRKRVITSRGTLTAHAVIIATNGYSDNLLPWLRRRLIPFDAHMISTARMDKDKVDNLIPHNRVCIDTNHNPFFVRPSPEGDRLLFGALTGDKPTTPQEKGQRLYQLLTRLLPEMPDVGVEHSWTGRCSGTFDLYPHCGSKDGIYYSLGYCFVGVPMGTYLGGKIAHAILGEHGKAATVFADRSFPTLPLYKSKPWFLPLVFGYYRHVDSKTNAGKLL